MGDDKDSFQRWLERPSDWKTRITVFVIIILAGIGFVAVMNFISPCRERDGCYDLGPPPCSGC